MSSSTVIGDVTSTLEQLLREGQRPKGTFAVTLESPADAKVDPGKPAVNLSLFRVEESEFARNEEWEAVGTDVLHHPPLTLSLYYLLTPLADNKLDEHRVFGEAMRVLYDSPVVAASLLKGVLENSQEELKLDLYRTTLEQLTQVWSAFGKPYRVSAVYRVRVVRIDSLVERATTRVGEHQISVDRI
ncbi:MAG: DUF4255 domain-containing protein [Acidobacteriota bacterium]|nr:DUF4255 domain-containing protein [Acidobacteriota bacterium]